MFKNIDLLASQPAFLTVIKDMMPRDTVQVRQGDVLYDRNVTINPFLRDFRSASPFHVFLHQWGPDVNRFAIDEDLPLDALPLCQTTT